MKIVMYMEVMEECINNPVENFGRSCFQICMITLFLFVERLLDLNTQLCFLIYSFSVAYLNIQWNLNLIMQVTFLGRYHVIFPASVLATAKYVVL